METSTLVVSLEPFVGKSREGSQGRNGLDPEGDCRVDHLLVEVKAGLVHRASAEREDARPGDGERVRVDPEVLHASKVQVVHIVEVVGDVLAIAGSGYLKEERAQGPARTGA